MWTFAPMLALLSVSKQLRAGPSTPLPPESANGVWTQPPQQCPSSKQVDGPLLGNGNVGVTFCVSNGGSQLDMYLSNNAFWYFSDDNIPGRPDSNASFTMGIGGVSFVLSKGKDSAPSFGFTQDIKHAEISWVAKFSNGSAGKCQIIGNWTNERSGDKMALTPFPSSAGPSSPTFIWNNTGDVSKDGWRYANGTVDYETGVVRLDYHRIEAAGCGEECTQITSSGCICHFQGELSQQCVLTMPDTGSWTKNGNDKKESALIAVVGLVQDGDVATIYTNVTNIGDEAVEIAMNTWAFNNSNGIAQAGVKQGTAWASRSAMGPDQHVTAMITSSIMSHTGENTISDGKAWLNYTLAKSSRQVSLHTLKIQQGQRGVTYENETSRLSVVTTLLEDSLSQRPHVDKLQHLITTSSEFWTEFWAKSWLSLPSRPALEQYWFRSQYILASSNREGYTAPGLWGSWLTSDTPAWHGDYTLNYNFQAPYYGVFSSNHVELLEPYFEAVLAFAKRQGGIDAAGYNCSCNTGVGDMPCVVHMPGHIAPGGRVNHGDMGQHTDASFAALHFVNYYKYTLNKTFAKQVSYPLLKAVASWWTCWLVKNSTGNGNYVYNDATDCTREQCARTGNDLNPAIAITYIKFIFTHLIELSEERVITPPTNELNKWIDINDNLAPIPTGVEKNSGESVLLCEEDPYYWQKGDNPLQFYALYPGEQIGLSSTSSLLNAARNTVLLMDSWDQGNAFCETFPAAVRAALAPEMILSQLTDIIERQMPPNGYLVQNGGGIETAGSTIAINEMLLQSWEGFLRFFPVWPLNESASFVGLRAVGAHLVSAAVDGKTKTFSNISILSEMGSKCTILNPFASGNTGLKVIANGQTIPTTTVSIRGQDGLFQWNTSVGETYNVVPA
eukprot:m.64285 g.64285  ORF g.64285 m.64285 type:complete len:898 (-) comp11637_c0_seq2:36-2729(-)